MKYDWIWFDADETLFHFDDFRGLQLMFERKGVEFTAEDFAEYHQLNKPLWVDYQDGKITAAELKHARFLAWSQKLETTTAELNTAFLTAMADICTPLSGAKELVEAIAPHAKLGIITNGFTDLQSTRLERTGMSPYFEHVVISEQVGVAKPDPMIFAHALTLAENPSKSKVLMVGDNPHSDILGGINAGIDTCWLNTKGAEAVEGIEPTHTVASLHELQQILLA